MQRVDEDADVGALRRLDHVDGCVEARNHSPGKELQHCAEAVARGQFRNGGESVGQAGEVRVVGGGGYEPGRYLTD